MSHDLYASHAVIAVLIGAFASAAVHDGFLPRGTAAPVRIRYTLLTLIAAALWPAILVGGAIFGLGWVTAKFGQYLIWEANNVRRVLRRAPEAQKNVPTALGPFRTELKRCKTCGHVAA